jgi:APA family basic amino acid/polyamine antiporter
MAQDGLLFRWAGEIHPRRRTPQRALILQAGWSSVLVATGTYRTLFTRVVYTEWIFFGLMAAGLIILRRRAGLVPIVFIIASFAIVVNQVVSSPGESVIGLALVAAGLPVYALWLRRRGHLSAGAKP